MDTLLVTPADLHCGSTFGLVPPAWTMKHDGRHEHSRAQLVRWRLWAEAWERIAEQRKRQRLIVVMNGDLIDGDHHDSKELITTDEEEQERMALECIHFGLRTAKFNASKGDRLFVVEGTEIHTNGGEERIARDLDAVPAIPPSRVEEVYRDKGGEEHVRMDGRFRHHELHVEINGKLIWIAHHALKVGSRAWTQENPLQADLRDIYFRQLEAKAPIPDLVIGAHYHRPTYQSFERNGYTIRGVVCPPFQNRPRHARRVVPNQYTIMGMAWHSISKDGLITRHDHTLPQYQREEIGVIKL